MSESQLVKDAGVTAPGEEAGEKPEDAVFKDAVAEAEEAKGGNAGAEPEEEAELKDAAAQENETAGGKAGVEPEQAKFKDAVADEGEESAGGEAEEEPEDAEFYDAEEAAGAKDELSTTTPEAPDRDDAPGARGLQRPREISDKLAEFLGQGKQMARTQVIKALWKYIKENDLQNPEDKREILLDERMKKVFGCDKFSMLTMQKYIGAHIDPFKPVDLTTTSTTKRPKKKKKREKPLKDRVPKGSLWTKSLQNLEKLPYDLKLNRKVIIGKGPFLNRIGHIEKWYNGWIVVKLAGLGTTTWRAADLYLHPDETQKVSPEKKRGRPPTKDKFPTVQYSVIPLSSSESESDTEMASPAKKRKGRPRKCNVDSNVTHGCEGGVFNEASEKSSFGYKYPDLVDPKLKYTRRKKDLPKDIDSQSKKKGPKSASAGETDPPKKKKGRPRKHPVASGTKKAKKETRGRHGKYKFVPFEVKDIEDIGVTVNVKKPVGVLFKENRSPFYGLVVQDTNPESEGRRVCMERGDNLMAVNGNLCIGKNFEYCMGLMQNCPQHMELLMFKGRVTSLYPILAQRNLYVPNEKYTPIGNDLVSEP